MLSPCFIPQSVFYTSVGVLYSVRRLQSAVRRRTHVHVTVSGKTKMAENKMAVAQATKIAKKFLIPLENTKQKLGNVLRGGEHLLSN